MCVLHACTLTHIPAGRSAVPDPGGYYPRAVIMRNPHYKDAHTLKTNKHRTNAQAQQRSSGVQTPHQLRQSAAGTRGPRPEIPLLTGDSAKPCTVATHPCELPLAHVQGLGCCVRHMRTDPRGYTNTCTTRMPAIPSGKQQPGHAMPCQARQAVCGAPRPSPHIYETPSRQTP